MEVVCSSDKARLILDIVLNITPSLTEEVRDIANISSTCSAWRDALRDAATHSACISSKSLSNAQGLEQLSSWIVPHAGLVGSLKLDRDLWPRFGLPEVSCKPDSDAETVALQSIVSAASAGTKLQRFSTNYLHSPAILHALPTTLQQLDLSKLLADPHNPPSSSEFIAAMARFSTLKQLSIGKAEAVHSDTPNSSDGIDSGILTPALLSALNSLPNLSQLMLNRATLTAAAAQQLPPCLTALSLSSCSMPEGLYLRQMSALQRLDLAPTPPALPSLEMAAGIAATAQLPSSLTALTVLMAKQRYHTLDLNPLQRLQNLTIMDSREGPAWLQQLAAQTSLKHVTLRYLHWKALITAAPVWKDLPQLQQLDLHCIDLRQHWQLELVLSSLAAATALTSLAVTKLITRQPVRLCAAVQALPNLASLAIEKVQLAKGDPLALTRVTSLTSLTSLSLIDCSSAVDDVAAVAVCLHLSKLQKLSITGQGLAGLGVLYPISAKLKDLRSLCLSGRSSCLVDDFGLQLLTSCCKLTELVLPGNPTSLAVTVQGLRRAVPGFRAAGVSICPTGEGMSSWGEMHRAASY